MKTLLEPNMNVQVPLFDGANYEDWREAMKNDLKSKGSNVWNVVASKKWYMENKTRSLREDQKQNSIAFHAIKKGLSNEVKMKLGS